MHKELEGGKRLHARIAEHGLLRDSYVANLLIQMYGQLRSVDSAFSVFRSLQSRNLNSWNIMITAFAQNGLPHEAQSLFFQAPNRDVVTWNSILSVSAQSSRIDQAREIFDKMPARTVISSNAMISAFAKAGHSLQARSFFNQMSERNTSTWNNMVNAYVTSGELAEARALFDEMPVRDIVTWSAMIQAYVQRQQMNEAEELFRRLQKPDVMTCTSMIVGYSSAGRISDAYHMFLSMKERDTVSWNAMIQAFADHGHTDKAREVFDAIPGPNLSSFNTMIATYAQKGMASQAEELFDRTRQRNVVTWTAMMNAYGQAGRLDDTKRILFTMPEPNTVSWSTLITACSQHGECREALQYFRYMDLDGFPPTRVTYVSVLYACSELTELQVGRTVHGDMRELHRDLYMENVVGNSVIHMYGRCGRLAEARGVFEEMVNRCVVSWNTLISGYAKTGYGAPEALKLFEVMNLDGGAVPNEITFLSILFACAHGGLVETARGHFGALSRDFGLEAMVDHYVCVVDVLARAGQVERAEELMLGMPYEPDEVTYSTFVAACRSQGMEVKAASAAMHILDLTPEDATGYVLLCNFNRPELARQAVLS